ncbi:MAG: hypothetical protein M1826_007098 [Phylliscum demangeonii]|nr:MAG: hypothetical protein M1826_007098 [Phylliscum demangeonii]
MPRSIRRMQFSPVLPFALTERAGVRPEHAIFGWMADRTGSRRASFLGGLVAIGAATGLLHIGNSVGILLVGRFVQGLADAMVFTVGLALVLDTVGPAHIGAAMSFPFMALSLGFLLAPLLGGVVYDRGGYNAVFAMAYALIGLDIVLRLLVIEKKVARQWMDDDDDDDDDDGHDNESAALDLTDPEKGAAAAESRPPTRPRPRPPPPPTAGKGGRRRRRLPPVISMLSSRRLLSALWCTLVQALVLAGFEAVYPLYVKQLFGWTATGAGLILLAEVVPSFLSPLVGRAADRYRHRHGPRVFVTAGFLLTVPAIVLLRLVDHDSVAQKVLLAALSVVVGLGLTLVSSPLLAEISHATAAAGHGRVGHVGRVGSGAGGAGRAGGAYAQAFGLRNSAFAAGALIGPLLCGFVKAAAGWKTMAWSVALLCAVTVVPALLFTGGLITRPPPDPRLLLPAAAAAAGKSKSQSQRTTTTTTMAREGEGDETPPAPRWHLEKEKERAEVSEESSEESKSESSLSSLSSSESSLSADSLPSEEKETENRRRSRSRSRSREEAWKERNNNDHHNNNNPPNNPTADQSRVTRIRDEMK